MPVYGNRKDTNSPLHILSVRRFLWVELDFLILLIVGAASIKEAVTVGGNAPLTYGKETENTETSKGMLVWWKTLKD
jgi:hypothetical protein